MNQPVWNARSSEPSTSNRSPKVRKSKSDEIGPKTIMNRSTPRMSQRAGSASTSGSTVSVGSAVWDAS